MKVITYYKCEICDHLYDSKEDALACEARGLPEEVPVGLIFNNASSDVFYKDITFAIAENNIHGHVNIPSMWACRDSGMSDSLGENRCGDNSVLRLAEEGIPDPDHQTFKRLVAWMQEAGIEPSCWDGEKGVPLEVFLSARRDG
jgi:rubredoxin